MDVPEWRVHHVFPKCGSAIRKSSNDGVPATGLSGSALLAGPSASRPMRVTPADKSHTCDDHDSHTYMLRHAGKCVDNPGAHNGSTSPRQSRSVGVPEGSVITRCRAVDDAQEAFRGFLRRAYRQASFLVRFRQWRGDRPWMER